MENVHEDQATEEEMHDTLTDLEPFFLYLDKVLGVDSNQLTGDTFSEIAADYHADYIGKCVNPFDWMLDSLEAVGITFGEVDIFPLEYEYPDSSYSFTMLSKRVAEELGVLMIPSALEGTAHMFLE